MLFLKQPACWNYKERDNTAKNLLKNGRSAGKTRPYVIENRNLVQRAIIDTKFFIDFLDFAATGDETGFTDTEMLLYRIKQSTETPGLEISETEREQVFNAISADVIALVNYMEMLNKDLTTEWRQDSLVNMERNGVC